MPYPERVMLKVLKRSLMLLVVCMGMFASPVFAADSENAVLQKEPTRSYGAIDVVLYETSWCPYCAKARAVLKELGVSLTEYDIEKDPARHAEMMEKSGGSRGVPVIDIEGIVLRGYSAEAIRAAVERQRRK